MIETQTITDAVEKVVVDIPAPPVVTFDKKVVLGTLAGLTVGAGATLLALKLKELKAKRALTKAEDAIAEIVAPINKK
jgi:hypothetical protein